MEKNKKRITTKVLNFVGSVIRSIEHDTTSLSAYFFFLFFVIQLRSLLEDFSAISGVGMQFNLHSILFYLCLGTAIILYIKLSTSETSRNIFKVVSLSFPLIMIGPLADILLYGFHRTPLTYYVKENIPQLLTRFITFFGSYNGVGASPGLRAHIFLIIACVFAYTYIKTQHRPGKALFCAFAVYCTIFALSISPFFLENIAGIAYSDNSYCLIFYFILIIILSVLFYFSNSYLFKTIVKDMRCLRTAYYLLLIMFGAALAFKQFGFVPDLLVLKTGVLFLSTVLAIFYSIVGNNIADIEIDRISNPARPLLQANFPVKDYQFFGNACLALSLLGSAIVSYPAFLLNFLFIGGYYIYSLPPIRFKRVPLFSKLIIALNSLFMALLGYSLFLSPNPAGYFFFSGFPTEYIHFFLLLTFAANFIDIKDYEGDKAAKVRTLPVLLGLEKAKKVIAFFFVIPYAYVALIQPDNILFCILFSLYAIRFLTTKDYDEKKIFYLLIISIALLTIDLLLT